MSNSKFKKFAIPGALVVGGITAGSFLAPIGLASAQEDTETDTESTESDAQTTESTNTESTDADSESTEDGRRGRHRRGHNHAERSEVLTETLGLTAEEIREGFQDNKSLADMAAEQGVAVADLQAALVAQASERIDEAVEAGKIDADEAAEKLAAAETKIEEMINTAPEDFEGRRGFGLSDRGQGHRAKGFKLGANIEEVEDLLGLSSEEIRTALQDGSTLSDLAEQQGVSVEALTDVLTDGLEERIDEAVAAGKIDADRAAEAKENIDERVENFLNREFDGERQGRGHRGHGQRGHRFGGGADGADGSDSDAGEVVESSFSA
jgi:polyhydroxyalkanoate synthesis regulator phasin